MKMPCAMPAQSAAVSAIPPGCPYNPRCPKVFDRCRVERPGLLPAGATTAACWLYDEAHAHA